MADQRTADERFAEWWNAQCLRGDPLRNPHLVRSAFDAGLVVGLERIPELERRVVELDAEAQREAIVADQILERAERLEAALRTIAEGVLPGGDQAKVLVPAHVQTYAAAALAAAPAPGEVKGDG